MLHVDMHILWTVVDLLILFVLLRIFLFKPVLGMIEKRKGIIQSSLSDADRANADAQALKTQYENSLKEAKKEGFEIVSEAKDRAQTQYDQIIEKANADATQIVKQANAAAAADREKILKDAQAELAGVALAAASKLLGAKVDDAANRDMLDKFLAEAGDGK
jgi:F-type H+-transporting ATPase subunit b